MRNFVLKKRKKLLRIQHFLMKKKIPARNRGMLIFFRFPAGRSPRRKGHRKTDTAAAAAGRRSSEITTVIIKSPNGIPSRLLPTFFPAQS